MRIIFTKKRTKKISADMINKKIGIHNGKNYVLLNLAPSMVNLKLGALSFSRNVLVIKKQKYKRKK